MYKIYAYLDFKNLTFNLNFFFDIDLCNWYI
jgi:hypothetical protein